MSYLERVKNIFLKHGSGGGDLASVIVKMEDEIETLKKDSARLDWLMNRAYVVTITPDDIFTTRQKIDEYMSMEAQHNDR